MSAASDTRRLPEPVTFTTGVVPRRPQVRPLGGLKPWPDSSSKTSQAPRSAAVLYRRPGLLPPGGDRRLITLGGLPGRDLHAPADPVQQQIQPGQRVVHLEPAAHQLSDPRQRPALILPAPYRRSGIQQHLQLAQLRRAQLAFAPPAPFDTSAARPPPDSARRHRFADIRDTRKYLATSRSLAPASINPAAASRTCSRRARSAPVSPPPSGYLMTPAYRTARQTSAP